MIDNSRMDWKNKIKRFSYIFLFSMVLGMALYHCVTVSNAASVTTGTVNTSSSSLNVRSGPGSNYGVIGRVAKGAQVTILGEENGWYKITFGTSEGYVSKDYIGNITTVEIDDSYMNELVALGFPQSYATALSTLHSKYPNWVFEPVLTGLDWNTVIAEESKLGRNLVQAANNDAQKSTAAGAYNWNTNKWIGFDGAGWVNASTEMIQYCMDPRNFLNEEEIFQFATNEYQEYQNTDGTSVLLKSSFMAGDYTEPDGTVKNYSQTFVEVGAQLGVNPYHLAARCLQEQGVKGSSGSISGTVSGYENYFNYFNIGAYPANGLTSVQNGLKYAKSKNWSSRYAAILGGSEVVGNNYIKKGQNTGYFQKFNVVNTVSGLYGHQYMTNVQAAISEGKNMKKAYGDAEAAILFRIPVYENMPEASVGIPNSGNPNNWIKSLTVEGYSLTPGFNAATTEYSLIVKEDVAAVKISGTPVANTSSISGLGEIALNYGDNNIEIICTAQNQSKRVYTLNIVRQGTSGTTDENKDDPNGEDDENGSKGMTGDVNGDGSVTLADLVAVKRHILAFTTLKDEEVKLADADGNGEITLADYVKIKRHILGYEVLK